MKIFADIIKEYTKTVGGKNEIDDAMTVLLFVQAIIGQQVLNPKWSWMGTASKQLFITALIIYVIFGTADVLDKVTDTPTIAEAYFTYLVITIFLFKYWFLLINRTYLRNAYLMAKTILFEIIKQISVQKAIDLVKKLKLIVKLFFVFIGVPFIIYILTALWFNMHGERVTLSKTTSILMPMTSPYYEIGFVLHAIYFFDMVFSICVLDVWFVVVMIFYFVTCDCLVMVLRVEPKAVEETKSAYEMRLNDSLRMFYIYHEKLMRYSNILCDMYKWAAVIPLISVIFSFCLMMFLMSEHVQLSFLANCIPILVEIFVYNWFGEQFKFKAMQLEVALINFDWVNMRLTDKRKYLIIITYMQKEFCIRTAFGIDLSLNTMTDVMKASYQAYTLLQTMGD